MCAVGKSGDPGLRFCYCGRESIPGSFQRYAKLPAIPLLFAQKLQQ